MLATRRSSAVKAMRGVSKRDSALDSRRVSGRPGPRVPYLSRPRSLSAKVETRLAMDSETNYIFFENREAWLLAGGGAGRIPGGRDCVVPSRALAAPRMPVSIRGTVGTSAGALNAAALAARASRMARPSPALRERVVELQGRTGRTRDPATMLRGGLHWMLSMATGGWLLPATPVASRHLPVARTAPPIHTAGTNPGEHRRRAR